MTKYLNVEPLRSFAVLKSSFGAKRTSKFYFNIHPLRIYKIVPFALFSPTLSVTSSKICDILTHPATVRPKLFLTEPKHRKSMCLLLDIIIRCFVSLTNSQTHVFFRLVS